MRVLIFGDSIAEGHYDCDIGGWVNRLKTFYYNTDRTVEIGSCGISGDTVPDILYRFDITAKSFIEKFKEEVIFVFAIGINDSAIIEGTKELYTAGAFKDNLEKLIVTANKYNPKQIVFVGLTTVNEDLTNPLLVSKTGKCYQNDRIKLFDKLVKKVSKSSGLKYIDVFDLLQEDDLDDGIHPNAEGHEKIFKLVENQLRLP